MAFVECLECGKEVPDTATHCIFCGCRLYSDAEMVRQVETQKETQNAKEAGKGYKFLKFTGVSILIIGFCVFLLIWLGAR